MRYWLTTRKGTVAGPYTVEELRRIQAKGEVDATSMICAEGSVAWTPAAPALRHDEARYDNADLATELRASVTLLRVLLVAEVVLTLVATLASRIDVALDYTPGFGSDELDKPTPMEWLIFCTGIPTLLLRIVSYVGLFRFWTWSRSTYTAASAIFVCLTTLSGLIMQPEPVEAAFVSLTYLTTGAILVTLFVTPVAQQFPSTRSS